MLWPQYRRFTESPHLVLISFLRLWHLSIMSGLVFHVLLGALREAKKLRFNSVPVENGSRYFNETVLKLKPWEVQNQTKSGL